MESRESFIREVGYTPGKFLDLLDYSADGTKERIEVHIDSIDIEYIGESIEREKEAYAWV